MEKTDKREELKAILDEALQEFPEIHLPPAFTDRLIRKIETRLAWRDLLAEFGLKLGLVIGALAILAIVLLIPGKKQEVSALAFVVRNWFLVAAIACIFLFTFFFDQVFLRFLFRRNKS